MRLYQRQKLLLSLVDAAGGDLAATDLQKLLFLYTRKCESEPSFKFVPYRFGGFSFQSYADRNTLIGKGMLLDREDSHWEISKLARPFLDSKLTQHLKFFIEKSVPERGKDLVRRVYKEAPFYALRSTILPEVFPVKKERDELLASIPRPKGKALFTIGYEGDSIDGYLARLVENDVRLLCDVRRNPLSRKTGFSKTPLSTYCSRIGVEYLHLPELGIPSHRRRELNTQADYDALFAEYEAQDLPQQPEAVERLLALLDQHERIALTCFELEPRCCHRHCVSEAMEAMKGCPKAQHI